MDESDLDSLVDALTPRVVEACRQHVSNIVSPAANTNRHAHLGPSSSRARAHVQPTSRQGRLGSSSSRARAGSQFVRGSQPSTSQPSTSRLPNNRDQISPRDELRRAFTRKDVKKRAYGPYQKKVENGRKGIDVVLLPNHKWSKVVRGKDRAKFHQDGLLIDKFLFDKSWSEKEVFDALFDAFREKLTLSTGDPISFCLKKPEGTILLQPRIAAFDSYNGQKICDIFSQKTVYLCPDRDLEVAQTVNDSSEDDESDEGSMRGRDMQAQTPQLECDENIGGGSVERKDVFTCPRCTFINPTSSSVCEMCYGSQDDDELSPGLVDDSTVQKARHKYDDPVAAIRDLTGFKNNRSQTVFVSRESLFEDNIAFFKKSFQVTQPLSIKFSGEMAIDAGGPLRENFRVLVQKLHSSELNYFFGTHSHDLLPSNNQMLLYTGMYEILGNIISAGIINGAPIHLPFHPAVIDCLLERPREEVYNHIHLHDVLDLELQNLLRQITECEDEDSLTKLVTSDTNSSHWLDNCGWPVSQKITLSCKHDLVMCVMFHYIIGIRSQSIAAIQKGMKCKDKFPMTVLSPDQLMTLLSPPRVTTAKLKELSSASIEKLRVSGSDTAKFVVRLVEDADDTQASLLAMFATGTDRVYSELTELRLELNNHNILEVSPMGNTCTATILFPVSYTEYEIFKSAMLKRMAEAVEFFGMF